MTHREDLNMVIQDWKYIKSGVDETEDPFGMIEHKFRLAYKQLVEYIAETFPGIIPIKRNEKPWQDQEVREVLK